MEEQRSLLLTESAWAWLDTDDFNLNEADPHMVISPSLWDNLAGDEVVARSLFSSSSSATDLTSSFEKSDSPQSSRSWNDELPPRPLKRRRVLQSNCDESSSSGSIGSSFSQAYEDSQAHDPSSFNWHMTNESISSADDAELSTESWMMRYFSDSDTSDIQDVPNSWTNNHLTLNAVAPQPSVTRVTESKNKHQIPKVPPRPSVQSRKRSGKIVELPGDQQINVISEAKQNPLHVKESLNPVLAYPFALVKPSRIQGDVTLQDINQRVNMPTSKVDASLKQPKVAMIPPASGKSVLGLTRIHTEGHQLQKAFKTIESLEEKKIPVSRDLIYSLLQECIKQKDIISGRRVYSLMVLRGLDTVVCFNDHLIHLFIGCGSLAEGNSVFDRVRSPKKTTWNAIISGHVTLGESRKALAFYQKMQEIKVEPDRVTIIVVLKACGVLGDLRSGRLIHGYIIEETYKVVCEDEHEEEVMLLNTLIDMYGKCKSIWDAFDVFDGLSNRSVTSWTVILSGYANNGLSVNALQLFETMMSQEKGCELNKSLLLVVLKACSIAQNVVQGRRVYDLIVNSKLEFESCIINTLVDMYSKCGSVKDARCVFEGSSDPDVVTWGTMISGYSENGFGHEALDAYKKMRQEKKGMKPNTAIMYSVLKACSIINDLEQGMLFHDEIRGADMNSDLQVRTGLIEMYSKCGKLDEASRVFYATLKYDHVLWEAMISAYIQHGYNHKAFEIFERLSQQGLKPRVETYTTLLKAHGKGNFCIGWIIHDQLVRNGHDLELIVSSALVNMYTKSGNLDEARTVFDSTTDRTVISWGGMIAGYVHQGYDLTALTLFKNMLKTSIKPDKATLSCILTACANVGALKEGHKVHELILKYKYELDVIVTSSLLDMYAKCGTLNEACKVFDSATYRDVALWGAVIASCTQHLQLDLASQYLTDMQRWGFVPNNTIFTSMLTACCSTGLLKEGQMVFALMSETYDIVPDKEHYSCMIDLLSRAGCLRNALELLSSIPSEPDIIMWTSLLTGCKIYGNAEMGNECHKRVLEKLNMKHTSVHAMVMSQLYSDACTYEQPLVDILDSSSFFS